MHDSRAAGQPRFLEGGGGGGGGQRVGESVPRRVTRPVNGDWHRALARSLSVCLSVSPRGTMGTIDGDRVSRDYSRQPIISV